MYAFVEKSVLSVLPVWEKNPDSDFSDVVDTPRLFKFLKGVREEDRVWVFPFDTAKDIISTLRIQFAHLFHEGLRTRMRLLGTGFPGYLSNASPDTDNIRWNIVVATSFPIVVSVAELWIRATRPKSEASAAVATADEPLPSPV